MPIQARIAHQMPGRMRIRVADMRGQREYFADTAEQLALIPGVLRITSTPETASLLIEHQGETTDLREALDTLFDFDAPREATNTDAPTKAAADWGESLDKLRRYCGNPHAGQALVALLLIAYGLWQLTRGGRQSGPDWFTALWVAYNLMAIK